MLDNFSIKLLLQQFAIWSCDKHFIKLRGYRDHSLSRLSPVRWFTFHRRPPATVRTALAALALRV
jgi:hypothetical protein